MAFKPVRQLSAILEQENYEPTLSWAFRVMLALNVPLVCLPLFFGFSFAVIWAAFGGYMLALIDYRGMHHKKIVVQSVATVIVFCSGVSGMLVASSVWLSVVLMFALGVFAALIRNWRDYGSTIGVAAGFFFLFGIAYPLPLNDIAERGIYLLAGCAWAITITLLSFQLQPANPLKRSIARIWRANTDLLDAILSENDTHHVIKKEMEVRSLTDHSADLFNRRTNKKGTGGHYEIFMELRRLAAVFSAALSAIHEEMEILRGRRDGSFEEAAIQKTVSSLAQASARMAIVVFNSRPEDLTVAGVRIKRFEVAVQLLKDSFNKIKPGQNEEKALLHFISALELAHDCLTKSLHLLEKKINTGKSDHIESYRLSLQNFTAGLNLRVFGTMVETLRSVSAEQLKYALRVAFALSVGVFIFKFYNIDHGYWIPLTLIIVIQPYYGATRKKGLERIIGTVAGTVLGGLVMLLPLPHNAVVALLVLVSFLVAYYLRNNYKVGVFFVTVMMVILLQLSQQASWQLIGWRVLSTLLGAILAFVATYIFWPVWEKQRFPVLLKDALLQVSAYLQEVIRMFNGDKLAHENWYRARRMAEAANSAVFASVQRMMEEPERERHFVDEHFAMVGMLIRSTREITSAALLARENKTTPAASVPAVFAREIFLLFQSLAQNGSYQKLSHIASGFDAVKKCLNTPEMQSAANALLRNEFEKIVFELEAFYKLRAELETKKAEG